ncbi:hypothetical protein ACUH96_08610 [Dermabacteraceae bacterium P13077]
MPPSPAANPLRNAPTRRALLIAGAFALSGCGVVRVGQPEGYTPPPPGLDELVRKDLLARAAALAAAAQRDGNAQAARLAEQYLSALATGAEKEAGKHPSPASAPPALTDACGALRETCAQACLAASDSLARLSAAIGASATMLLHTLTGAEVPPPGKISVPWKDPGHDPVTVAPKREYETALKGLTEVLYEGAYALQAVAAGIPDATLKARYAARAEKYLSQADALAAQARQEGLAAATPRAAYRLPDSPQSAAEQTEVPRQVATAVLDNWVVCAGAFPAAKRAEAVRGAYSEADYLASLGVAPDPLPGLRED